MSRQRNNINLEVQSLLGNPAFNPLLMPAEAHSWRDLFSLLIDADFVFNGSCGYVSGCGQALSGGITSMSQAASTTLPDGGHADYRYTYSGQGAPRLHLNVQVGARKTGHSRINMDREDPEWIFLPLFWLNAKRAPRAACASAAASP